MYYDHRVPVVRGVVLEIMVYAAADQMISLSHAARLPVDSQDLPHMPMSERHLERSYLCHYPGRRELKWVAPEVRRGCHAACGTCSS